MAIQRTVFRSLPYWYYRPAAEWDAGTCETCHGCQNRLYAGNRYCYLRNVTNEHHVWCYRCARQFERAD